MARAFSYEMSTVQYFMRSPSGNRSRERERERERENAEGGLPSCLGKGERSGWDGGRFLLARKIFGSAFALQCNFPKHVLDNTRFRFPVVAISREPNTFPLNKCTRPIALHSEKCLICKHVGRSQVSRSSGGPCCAKAFTSVSVLRRPMLRPE